MDQYDSDEPIIPPDFPVEVVKELFRLLQVLRPRTANDDAWMQTRDAWNAALHRFYAMCDHDEKFRKLLNKHGPNPSDKKAVHFQDREIFEFFVNAVTVVDSYFFGCYMLGAAILPEKFPIVNHRGINPLITAKKYVACFAGQQITLLLDDLLKAKEYAALSDTRNILAHRLLPGRLISHTIYADKPGIEIQVKWDPQLYSRPSLEERWGSGQLFNGEVTNVLRRWMMQELKVLIVACNEFLGSQIDKLPLKFDPKL